MRTRSKPVSGGRSQSDAGREAAGLPQPAARTAGPGGVDGCQPPATLTAPPPCTPRGNPSQRRHDHTRPCHRPPAPPGAAGTHLMTVPLAPPAVVSMTRVVRLPRRSSGSRPSSAAQHSSAGSLRGLGVQPPAGKATAVTAPPPAQPPARTAALLHSRPRHGRDTAAVLHKILGKNTGDDLAVMTKVNVNSEAMKVCLWKQLHILNMNSNFSAKKTNNTAKEEKKKNTPKPK